MSLMKLSSKEGQHDELFEQSRKHHLSTVGFLTILKNNFSHEEAFKLAIDSFTNYMVKYYELILTATEPGSQERFDKFRNHYAECAVDRDYLHIIESKPNILRVRFERCPFSEVMTEYNLDEFSYAFCLSDLAFTKEVLPGVKFHRGHVIAKGDKYCDHTWIFEK